MRGPKDSELEEILIQILRDMYGPNTRQEVIDEVTVEVLEQQGNQYSVNIGAHGVELDRRKSYRWESDDYDIEAQDVAAGMGGSYELKVSTFPKSR